MTTIQENYNFIFKLIDECENYYQFHIADLAIDFFKITYPEQKEMYQILIDSKVDKYFEKLGNPSKATA